MHRGIIFREWKILSSILIVFKNGVSPYWIYFLLYQVRPKKI